MDFDHMPDDFGYFGEELLLEEDLDNKMWTTRDHRKVHVSDMTTHHIYNCIKLIESGRHPNITHVLGLQYIAMFDSELQRRSQKRLEYAHKRAAYYQDKIETQGEQQ